MREKKEAKIANYKALSLGHQVHIKFFFHSLIIIEKLEIRLQQHTDNEYPNTHAAESGVYMNMVNI